MKTGPKAEMRRDAIRSGKYWNRLHGEKLSVALDIFKQAESPPTTNATWEQEIVVVSSGNVNGHPDREI